MIPRKVPIYAVTGKVIYVRKAMDPSDPRFDQAVDEFHKRMMEGIREVYEKHKSEYGWENRPLLII